MDQRAETPLPGNTTAGPRVEEFFFRFYSKPISWPMIKSASSVVEFWVSSIFFPLSMSLHKVWLTERYQQASWLGLSCYFSFFSLMHAFNRANNAQRNPVIILGTILLEGRRLTVWSLNLDTTLIWAGPHLHNKKTGAMSNWSEIPYLVTSWCSLSYIAKISLSWQTKVLINILVTDMPH